MTTPTRAGWRTRLARVKPRDRAELMVLLGTLAALVMLIGFFALAAEVFDGDTQRFDEHVLSLLRRPDDPGVPIGPDWVRRGAMDITSLGSPTVLGLTMLAVCGYLILLRLYRTSAFVFVACTGGWVLNSVLKQIFQRARPGIVPHLQDVMSLSFPSGHAMTSAAVYLTLGALLMRVSTSRLTKFYVMAIAILATVLVGLSRLYLGVHYPTDVLAGWMAGMIWATLCWVVERRVERRAGLQAEQRAQASTS